jgi:putative ABC transport system substrate-binding protein
VHRRAFVGSLALGLLAPPLAAGAQQAAKVYQVGLVSVAVVPGRPTVLWRAFLQAMRELNYVEGRNLVVRQAFSAGKREVLPGLVADLVKKQVDVIVTTSTPETLAAKQATSTIPIVMTVALDPVGQGLVESLARPGGNVTGLTILVAGLSQKYVELLKEVVPSTSRLAVVTGPAGPFPEIRNELQAAAQQVGVTLSFGEVNGPDEIDAVLARAKKDGSGGIIAPLDGRTYLHRRALAQLALKHRLPGIYWSRDYVEDGGGLMAYGASLADLGRRAATFVDKILKGAKPADLPVEQPTKFELVINLKTAKTLGLTIPQSLLLRADQVIE